MNVFDCTYRDSEGHSKRWDGCWIKKESQTGQTELIVKGRGSMYHVILGYCSTGNYMCIPEQRISCPLSSLLDKFWNYEQISTLLGPVDAWHWLILTYIKKQPDTRPFQYGWKGFLYE